MKKLLSLLAALLLGLPIFSQEADEPGSHAEVTIIPRLDLNPSYNFDDGKLDFDLGNSSLYTVFEGSISEHVSFLLINHWINAGGDYWWPYTNIGRSDSTNLFDFANFSFDFGGWNFTVGKDIIKTCGFEFEAWDWDAYTKFSSPLFSGLNCYQWGVSVGYTLPSEMSEFYLQMTTSPYGEHPFSSALWAYSAQWRGYFDRFSTIFSYSAFQRDKGQYDQVVSLGQKADFSDRWNLSLDWSNVYGYNEDYTIEGGSTFRGELHYLPSEKFDLAAMGTYSYSKPSMREFLPTCWSAGLVLQAYPLRSSKDLRLSAVVGYDSVSRTGVCTIGACYNFHIKAW